MLGKSIQSLGSARVWLTRTIGVEGFKAPGTKPATLAEEGLSYAWAFADNDDETVLGHFMMPLDIDRINIVQPKLLIHWGCDDNSGNAYWQVEYLWFAPNEDMTNTTPDDTVASIVAASGTADGMVSTEIQLADFGATDVMLHLRIKRLGADGSDTLTGDTHLHCACIKYVTKNG